MLFRSIANSRLKNHRPATGLDAIFSLEFAMAAALVAGNVGLREVSDDFVRRADVQALIGRVTVVSNEDYDPEWPSMSRYDQVRIRLNGGESIESEKVHRALGDASRPLSPDDLRQKFFDCFAAGQSAIDATRLLADLQRIESLPSCRVLFEQSRVPIAA